MNFNLKRVREKSGKTQEEVANDLGVSLSTYRSWEQNKRGLNGKKLTMLADYFAVTTDEIIGTRFAPEPEPEPETDESLEEIIAIYMALNDEGRRMLLELADSLARSGKYEKKSVPNHRLPRVQAS